jgi:hypothetical protein
MYDEWWVPYDLGVEREGLSAQLKRNCKIHIPISKIFTENWEGDGHRLRYDKLKWLSDIWYVKLKRGVNWWVGRISYRFSIR